MCEQKRGGFVEEGKIQQKREQLGSLLVYSAFALIRVEPRMRRSTAGYADLR